MVISELVNHIKNTLKDAGMESYDFETMCIAEDILKIEYATAFMNKDECSEEKVLAVNELLKKRTSGEPLQYLLGQWEFYGYTFKVGKGVLIPRPDTETLIDAVREHFKSQHNETPVIVDLCSGSGCIAITLARQIKGCKVYAVELSSDAMPYLTENIKLNNADVKVLKGDVCDGKMLENFADTDSPYDFIPVDCIVSNPPYLTDEEMTVLQKEVRFEPSIALDGGVDGLKFYRIITCLWKEVLKDGGLLAYEIGYRQAEQVKDILKENGFKDIKIVKDLGHNDRVVSGIK